MANLYDLKKFALTLLVIFECIYQHLSLTKAALSLNFTPSAVPQPLQRLRPNITDNLFIRPRQRYQHKPTPQNIDTTPLKAHCDT